jgi:hypothetical protein
MVKNEHYDGGLPTSVSPRVRGLYCDWATMWTHYEHMQLTAVSW